MLAETLTKTSTKTSTTEKTGKTGKKTADARMSESVNLWIKGVSSTLLFSLTLGVSNSLTTALFVLVSHVTTLVCVATLPIESIPIESVYRVLRKSLIRHR